MTKLPAYTNPSSAVLVKRALLLCSRTHKKVYRLRIDAHEAAHWQGVVPGLRCDRDIASLPDGSVITAQTGMIYRYPPA